MSGVAKGDDKLPPCIEAENMSQLLSLACSAVQVKCIGCGQIKKFLAIIQASK